MLRISDIFVQQFIFSFMDFSLFLVSI